MLRGLMVSILRDAGRGGDCTNGGVTSPERAPNGRAILLGVEEGNWQEGELPKDMPILVIRRRTIGGREYLSAVPYENEHKRHVMSGGNFVYSSDSRFNDVCPYPIPVHDRME